MAPRVVRVEGSKLWISTREDPDYTLSPTSRRQQERSLSTASRLVTHWWSRTRTDMPIPPRPRLDVMYTRPEVVRHPAPSFRDRIKARSGVPVDRDWLKGCGPWQGGHSKGLMGWKPREEATVTVQPRDNAMTHWQERFGGLTQGMRLVGEYHREFMLLRDAVP
ncbi:unnamed protein product [Arabis nemorensis]|uniref:Uncharacterized protein n=1 Tax=Arabis nemorensis TaxID=586526 RepID=A0A565C4V2_9BRAS|nr:unnamed protein product [Arabis nemorensis]